MSTSSEAVARGGVPDHLIVGPEGIRAEPSPDETPSDRRRAWGASFLIAAAVALAARAVFFTVAYGAQWLTNDGTGHLDENAFAIWERWDARHLLDIAQNGYDGAVTTAQPEAFFPLFPLLARAVGALGTSPVIAGLIVSTVATVVALAYLHRMAEEEVGAGTGRRAALYLAFFPTAVFLVAPYTESLFLAGAIPAFYFARRRRWLWVGPPAAVAMGSRAVGVFLLAGLAVEFLRQRPLAVTRVYEAAIALTTGVLPLLAYGAWLRAHRGSAFAFFEAQEAGWGRAFTSPYDSLLNTWHTWNNAGYPTNWLLIWRLEVVAAFVGVAFVVWALARREWGFATFMAGSLAALVTSAWFYSIPRMLLTLFPVYLFLASATRRRPGLHEPLLACSAVLATLGVIVFTRSMWFF